jgi:hypothetical protein
MCGHKCLQVRQLLRLRVVAGETRHLSASAGIRGMGADLVGGDVHHNVTQVADRLLKLGLGGVDVGLQLSLVVLL